MGTDLLESLEAAGLLDPRIRIRYPYAIARRFWVFLTKTAKCQFVEKYGV